jgi:hypothetical protein
VSVSPSPLVVRSRRTRAGLVVASGMIAVAMLAGCAPEGPGGENATGTAAPTGTATDAPAPGPSAAPGNTATPAPEPAGTAVGITCDQLLTAEDVYTFNPNVGTAPDYSPTSGGTAATAAKYDGIACGLLNQSSGEVIEISVAVPNDVLMTQLKNAAVSGSTAVPTYGTPPAIDGFFSKSGDSGLAQVFSGKYWLTASSTAFVEPGEPLPLLKAAVSHLP